MSLEIQPVLPHIDLAAPTYKNRRIIPVFTRLACTVLDKIQIYFCLTERGICYVGGSVGDMYAGSLNIPKRIVFNENFTRSDQINRILHGVSGKFAAFDRVILDITAFLSPARTVLPAKKTGHVVCFVIDDRHILEIVRVYAMIINPVKCIPTDHYVVCGIVL